MGFLQGFLFFAGIGAAVWYGIYRLHMHLKNARWEHGLDEMPDKAKLIPKYVISYLTVQVIMCWLLAGLANFPAQR